MDPTLEQVFDRLADGRAHSGQQLAAALGVSRSAIWKHIETLRALGLEVPAHPGGGYQLARPIQRPRADRIRERLDREIALDLRFLVDSTNACMQRERRDHPPPRALIAEAQSLGRGRRERPWRSPPGAGLYLSLSWRFESGLTGLSALSLVTGIAVAGVLRTHGLGAIRLKWPNDLWVEDCKLGGCLIEISGSAEGPCEAVTGVGINLDLGESRAIDQPWTDLARLGIEADRNALFSDLINALARAYRALDRSGFKAFEQLWSELDALAGRRVRLIGGGGKTTEGIACGVDAQGRLLLDRAGDIEAIGSGELSVRCS
jgi:BirA family biotin operon repressor/biotin-[acetyl-CoA-carboxylase] ligase